MKRKQKIIIGLAGHPSSGKDTVAEYLVSRHGFVHISTSDLLRDYIKENNLGEPTRALMYEVGTSLRKEHGPDYLSVLALKKEAPRMIISGLRSVAEAERIKKSGGYIVALKAPIEFRYEWALKRGRAGDGTFEEFKAAEEKEARSADPNAQNVEGVMRIGDFIIENNALLENLYSQIEEIVKKL